MSAVVHQLTHVFLLVYAGLFPIVNPVGNAPIFLALTRYCTDRQRRALALRVAINGFFLLLGSLIVGLLLTNRSLCAIITMVLFQLPRKIGASASPAPRGLVKTYDREVRILSGGCAHCARAPRPHCLFSLLEPRLSRAMPRPFGLAHMAILDSRRRLLDRRRMTEMGSI